MPLLADGTGRHGRLSKLYLPLRCPRAAVGSHPPGIAGRIQSSPVALR